MEDLPEKLKKLARNKYFIILSVIFFAFITALVFAFISASETEKSTQDLRKQIQNGVTSRETAQAPSSIFDKILTRIGLKKSITSQTADTSTPQNQNAQNQTTTITNLVRNSPPLPSVNIDKYTLKTQLPSAPPVLRIYSIKTGYTQDEIQSIANNMGMTSFDVISHNGPVSQIYDLSSNSYLSFNTLDGTFLFMSESGVQSNITDPTASARFFLNRTSINNDCIRPYSTYQRISQPGSTFVEFHCDPSLFGGPILSSVGILNLPTSIKLSQVSPGEILGNEPVDNDISSSSDGANYRRMSDFNTIVVEIKDTNGAVLSASSNIPFSSREEILPQDKLMPPSQIISQLEAGRSTLSLTSPLGEGFLDLSTVYANGAAVADNADIQDIYTAYDMSPSMTGSYLCPSYFVRSYGRVMSGYDAQFVETVPAVNDPRCTGAVLGEHTLAQYNPAPTLVPQVPNSALKYGTFQYIPTVPEEHESSCPVDQFTNAYAVPGHSGVYMAWIDKNTLQDIENKQFNNKIPKRIRGSGSPAGRLPQGPRAVPKGAIPREWYIVTVNEGSGITADQLSSSNRQDFVSLRASLISRCRIGRRESCPVPEGFTGQVVSCIYLTSGSPHIRIYPAHQTQFAISVNPASALAYADPGYNNGIGNWKTTVSPDSTFTVDGVKKTSLYWEFDKAPIAGLLKQYHSPASGYIVKKSQAVNLLKQTIAVSLKLTSQETNGFAQELSRETSKISSDTLKISFISREFLDAYLSMEITPAPDKVYRFILYVEPASDGEYMAPPRLTPIVRSGIIAVETGVIAGE